MVKRRSLFWVLAVLCLSIESCYTERPSHEYLRQFFIDNRPHFTTIAEFCINNKDVERIRADEIEYNTESHLIVEHAQAVVAQKAVQSLQIRMARCERENVNKKPIGKLIAISFLTWAPIMAIAGPFQEIFYLEEMRYYPALKRNGRMVALPSSRWYIRDVD